MVVQLQAEKLFSKWLIQPCDLQGFWLDGGETVEAAVEERLSLCREGAVTLCLTAELERNNAFCPYQV